MTSARFLLRITPLLLLLPAVLGAAIKDNQNSDNEEEREEFVGNSLFKREPSPSYTDTIIAVIEAARRQVESVERRRNDLYDEFQRLSFDDDDDDDEDETDAVDGESSIVNLAERMVDLETGDVFLRSVEEKKKQQQQQQQQQEKKNDEKIDETKIETIITQVNKQRKTLKVKSIYRPTLTYNNVKSIYRPTLSYNNVKSIYRPALSYNKSKSIYRPTLSYDKVKSIHRLTFSYNKVKSIYRPTLSYNKVKIHLQTNPFVQ